MAYIILIALPLLMYLLVIRPQSQRIKAQRTLVGQLAVGDEVISSAGIFGRITALTDDVATLLVAPGVELRVARGAIASRVAIEGAPDDAGSANDEIDLSDHNDHRDPELGASAPVPEPIEDHTASRED